MIVQSTKKKKHKCLWFKFILYVVTLKVGIESLATQDTDDVPIHAHQMHEMISRTRGSYVVSSGIRTEKPSCHIIDEII